VKPTYILGLVGSLITLTLLFELLRRRRLREKYAVFWVIVATATLVIALFPNTLTAAAVFAVLCVVVPGSIDTRVSLAYLVSSFVALGAMYASLRRERVPA